jgi:hypothetical protein
MHHAGKEWCLRDARAVSFRRDSPDGHAGELRMRRRFLIRLRFRSEVWRIVLNLVRI